MANVFILRGVQGAGKSTVAKELSKLYEAVVVSADDYFMQDGEYQFDASKLLEAHAYCQYEFQRAIVHWKENIIVDNTNALEKDFQWYIDTAKDFGYNVISLVVENRHGNDSIHNVPHETRKRTETRIRQSLRLM